MKKIILLFFALISLSVNAQIYNHISVQDKFEDIVFDRERKTLVTQTDSSFVIEEKGFRPVCYRIINYAEYNSMGSEEEIVKLADNVYGYQKCWHVVLENDLPKYLKALKQILSEPDHEKMRELTAKNLGRYSHFITHRLVKDQITKQTVKDFLILQKGDSDKRRVYFDM